MDTDELSRETYYGIIIEAEELSHDLTLHFGLLSYECKDEKEYIDKAEVLVEEMLELDDDEYEDFFWGVAPDKRKLKITLKKILVNIENIRKIPFEKREFDF